MILLVDIGNTTMHVGLSSLVTHGWLSTSVLQQSGPGRLSAAQRGQLGRLVWAKSLPVESIQNRARLILDSIAPYRITGAAVASVVPHVTRFVTELIEEKILDKPLVVSHRTSAGVNIDYSPRRTLGADRIANAVAAYYLFPGDTVVVDMGTATTLEVVLAGKGFIGGMILPGLQLMLRSLSEASAQLPLVKLRRQKIGLATSTRAALLSGVLASHFGGITAALAIIRRQIGRQFNVVVTGGLAKRFGRLVDDPVAVDPHLTLRGLKIIYMFHGPIRRDYG